MRKLTFWLLVAFVSSLPWEQAVTLGPFGSVSRLLGAAAVGSGMLAVWAQRWVRPPGVLLWLALAFVGANVLSLLWTIDLDASVERVLTYGQLLAIAWLVWEFARRAGDDDVVFAAFCMGACLSLASQFSNVMRGLRAVAGSGPLEARYAATNADPNDFGFMLALTIPMAWYFFVRGGRLTRLAVMTYLPVVVAGILLTASRGAALGAVAALCVIPFTLQRDRLRSWLGLGVVAILAVGAAVTVVPATAWARVLTAVTELQGGTMSGRTIIWQAGFDVFLEHPLVGVGAGAFSSAVESMVGGKASHSVPLAILVEQGALGFLLFAVLLAACAWHIFRLPAPARAIWTAISITWLPG